MFQNPTFFPEITNRESWWQIVELSDDDTGDLISLTDANGNPLYSISLEIIAAQPRGHFGNVGAGPFYDCDDTPIITGSLANYISILDVGTIQIFIPKSVMTSLRSRTYDVFLTIDPTDADDGRQIWIGRLPVLYGGRNT